MSVQSAQGLDVSKYQGKFGQSRGLRSGSIVLKLAAGESDKGSGGEPAAAGAAANA